VTWPAPANKGLPTSAVVATKLVRIPAASANAIPKEPPPSDHNAESVGWLARLKCSRTALITGPEAREP
jgi:hypothetical protein